MTQRKPIRNTLVGFRRCIRVMFISFFGESGALVYIKMRENLEGMDILSIFATIIKKQLRDV